MHHAIATGSGQDLVFNLVLGPHPRPQDVLPTPLGLVQLLDRFLADHAPVGHNADLADGEPAAQAIHHRDQRGHVGGVAGPEFAADRPSLTVEHDPDDHRLEVRSMILAVAALTDGFSPLSLEVDAGGVEEDQLEFREQITSMGEQPLFDQVLGAARGKRRLVRLLHAGQLLSEPGHGPVEMMELQGFASFDLVILLPLVGGPIAAGVEEAMCVGSA